MCMSLSCPGALPTLDRGHARFERDVNDSPERQPPPDRAHARAHACPTTPVSGVAAAAAEAVQAPACRLRRPVMNNARPPASELFVTQFLVVSDQDRSRDFYRSVFGADVLRAACPGCS